MILLWLIFEDGDPLTGLNLQSTCVSFLFTTLCALSSVSNERKQDANLYFKIYNKMNLHIHVSIQ